MTAVCDAVAAALCKQAVERIARVREVRLLALILCFCVLAAVPLPSP